MTWLTWRDAMTRALYGPDGFYRRAGGPAAHFRTSVHVSPLFAEALLRLAARVFDELDHPDDFVVVDIGAGRGELLRHMALGAPEAWRLVGVDVVGRPEGLPERVEWLNGVEAIPVLPHAFLVANEWLDNVPLDVMVDDRLLEVDERGRERPGPSPSERDLAWCNEWALPVRPGARVEIGWPREDAWSDVADKVQRGLALAIDYSTDRLAPWAGSLTGYRGGRQVAPVPDGSCDLTAHVDFAALSERRRWSWVTDQCAALSDLGLSAVVPPRELASTDPRAYLQRLAIASEARELLDPQGLGAFGWLVEPRDLARPEVFLLGAESLG